MDSRNPWGRLAETLLTLVLGLGAAGARADLSDEGHVGQQGTHLYGATNHGLENVSVSPENADFQGTRLDGVVVQQGELTAEWRGSVLRGTDLTGTRLTVQGADPSLKQVQFHITQARRHDNVYTGGESHTVWQYLVEWEAASGEHGLLCPGEGWALPIPGRWSAGAYLPFTQARVFSFACLPVPVEGGFVGGGLAAKCVDWGYPPWQSEDGLPNGNRSPAQVSDENAQRHHAACVGMASADYCGEGLPNTVDGTPITMFNSQNVWTSQVKNPVSSETQTYVSEGPFGPGADFLFEAAWKADLTPDPLSGAMGWRPGALCLTKKRWSTLPLNGVCSQLSSLKDPRVEAHARDCESTSASELLSEGALLFSYSTYIDAGLYRFKKVGTGSAQAPAQYLTTASVFIDPWATYPQSYHPLGVQGTADYELDVNGGSSVFEGSILSPQVPRTFLGLSHTTPLLRYSDGARYFTQVEGMRVPPGYTLERLEGFVYTDPQPPGNAPALTLWGSSSGDRFATSTTNPDASFLDEVAHVGYLPPLRDYARLLP